MDEKIGLGLYQSCRNLGSVWVAVVWVGLLGGYMRILGAHSVQSCCTLSIAAFYHVFVYGRYRKFRLVCM